MEISQMQTMGLSLHRQQKGKSKCLVWGGSDARMAGGGPCVVHRDKDRVGIDVDVEGNGEVGLERVRICCSSCRVFSRHASRSSVKLKILESPDTEC